MYANLAKIFTGDFPESVETPGLSSRVDRYVINAYSFQFLNTIQSNTLLTK